jgi:hypothetical protein
MKHTTESRYDLGYYFSRFPDAVEQKYGKRFELGFAKIEQQYKEIRSGRRILTVDDVMDLFDPDLPFVSDWTMPDTVELERKMVQAPNDVGKLIRDLGVSGYDLELITEIRNCFRELSLVALVLHHVYPDRFAIVSHHLASLLHITGPTVPAFYIEYCKELRIWSEREWHTPGVKTVVHVEFALWTWYRFAFSGGTEARGHRVSFTHNRWIQGRRAARVARSLGPLGKLDLARSYLDTDPTVAAMIAWRELEIRIREIIGRRAPPETVFHALINRLTPTMLPPGISIGDLHNLRRRRNSVTHEGAEIEKMEAGDVLEKVAAFVERNAIGPAVGDR